jgi:peptidoglycan/LPS O-acetylase OafA/YrhL
LFLAGFPLALTAAVVSWHLFEYPSLKFRKSFVIKHRREIGLGSFEDRTHAANSFSIATSSEGHARR